MYFLLLILRVLLGHWAIIQRYSSLSCLLVRPYGRVESQPLAGLELLDAGRCPWFCLPGNGARSDMGGRAFQAWWTTTWRDAWRSMWPSEWSGWHACARPCSNHFEPHRYDNRRYARQEQGYGVKRSRSMPRR